MTFPSWPQFNPTTPKRVAAILKSGRVNYWTGDEGRRFEETFASWLGVHGAASVSNGTAALHLALEALGVGAGDEVVCTPYSFIASSSCAANALATPVYADVGADHMLNAETIAHVLTPRTKAIVVVHLFGQVADLGPILKLARERHLFVVEDCAQCLGGEWRGRKVGTVGDAGCFSFCQSKHFTTGGEGGMVVARSKAVLRRVRSLRDHGWVVGSSPKRYERVGYNFRMTEMQSAVGLGEMERLEGWNLPRRRLLSERLVAALRDDPLVRTCPVDTPERRASFWLVPFVLDPSRLTCSVARFIESMQSDGASVYKVMWPLPVDLPMASSLAPNTIGFWVHPVYALRHIDASLAAFRRAKARWSRLVSASPCI